jgi:hypothetical protein
VAITLCYNWQLSAGYKEEEAIPMTYTTLHAPAFIAPIRYTDAAAALAQIQTIYQASVSHLRGAFREFVTGTDFKTHVRACYPFVRLQPIRSRV